MSELLLSLMNREDMTKSEALEVVLAMKQRVAAEEDPEEVLYEEGFEPDYILDLI
jgi:hypothetical protein